MRNLLSINLSAISENYQLLQNLAPNSLIGAVVKANCYGLGSLEITKHLITTHGCKNFFVANLDEALTIHNFLNIPHSHVSLSNGIKIFILSGIIEEPNEYLVPSIVPVLNNLTQCRIWHQLAAQLNRRLPAALHLDTGLHRLGMSHTEIKQLINSKFIEPIELTCILSHLASSEDSNSPYNRQQYEKFLQLVKYFPKTLLSLASSSGIFLGKDYHFDMIRPGAALYGLNPQSQKANIMRNVVTVTSPIIHLQSVPAGRKVGYNMTFTTEAHNNLLATIPVGYADGYNRLMSNNSFVYIGNEKANVVGRISMDLLTIDVTNIKQTPISIGTMVELVNDKYTIDDIARLTHTIGYETLLNISRIRGDVIYKI